jgi:hypothetical protein
MEKNTMTLDDLTTALSANPKGAVRLVLPDGSFVPSHFHVTEVGRVQKDFIDCGGTLRHSVACVLQVWIANDVDHRLEASKLAGILRKGITLFESTDVPLEVEYDSGVISQYPVLKIEATPEGVIVHLETKHTNCLAQDRCGVRLDVVSACSDSGCC